MIDPHREQHKTRQRATEQQGKTKRGIQQRTDCGAQRSNVELRLVDELERRLRVRCVQLEHDQIVVAGAQIRSRHIQRVLRPNSFPFVLSRARNDSEK